MTKYTEVNSNFGANGPFFHIIREGLKGLLTAMITSICWPMTSLLNTSSPCRLSKAS